MKVLKETFQVNEAETPQVAWWKDIKGFWIPMIIATIGMLLVYIGVSIAFDNFSANLVEGVKQQRAKADFTAAAQMYLPSSDVEALVKLSEYDAWRAELVQKVRDMQKTQDFVDDEVFEQIKFVDSERQKLLNKLRKCK